MFASLYLWKFFYSSFIFIAQLSSINHRTYYTCKNLYRWPRVPATKRQRLCVFATKQRRLNCSDLRVLHAPDRGVLSVNFDSTLGDVLHGVCTGQLDSTDGFHLDQRAICWLPSNISCSVASTHVGKFWTISFCVNQCTIHHGIQ